MSDDDEDKELAALPSNKNYITPKGMERLRAEYYQLLEVERPALTKIVSWAAGNGDRSENGDYIYGKRRMREIDKRLRFLSKRMERAEIIDPATVVSTRVQFGATVTLAGEDGGRRVVRIIGIDESKPAEGLISWISPLARTILGRSVGDVVEFRSPKGEEEIEILKVEYKGIE